MIVRKSASMPSASKVEVIANVRKGRMSRHDVRHTVPVLPLDVIHLHLGRRPGPHPMGKECESHDPSDERSEGGHQPPAPIGPVKEYQNDPKRDVRAQEEACLCERTERHSDPRVGRIAPTLSKTAERRIDTRADEDLLLAGFLRALGRRGKSLRLVAEEPPEAIAYWLP